MYLYKNQDMNVYNGSIYYSPKLKTTNKTTLCETSCNEILFSNRKEQTTNTYDNMN